MECIARSLIVIIIRINVIQISFYSDGGLAFNFTTLSPHFDTYVAHHFRYINQLDSWTYTSQLLKHLSRDAIPNVDSRVPNCKYARIQLWGRIEEVHSEKRLKSWLRWRDIKKSPISVYCFNKIWRVLYWGLICRRNTCDLIAIDCLGHYSYIKERTEVTINMDQFTLHPWWPYDDCD